MKCSVGNNNKKRNANKTKTPRKGKRVVDGKTPGKKLRKITSKLD